jgi:tRNA (mo5U34)-methyltransferase
VAQAFQFRIDHCDQIAVPDYDIFFDRLEQAGLASWRAPLEPVLRNRFAEGAHGDIGRWRAVIDKLPDIADASTVLNLPAVTAASSSVEPALRSEIKDLLLRLQPWRKGPFNIFGIGLDAEWRSDLKWDRLKDEIAPLEDRRILDVGCGNGYYALRMAGDGAQLVVGIDPMLLFVFQFLALNHFLAVSSVDVLPLRLHELPDARNFFDTTFSMGVLYHQRKPLEHLARLRGTLRPGGELVLETLILPGAGSLVHEPEGRYARMRNVWHLPTAAALEEWLRQAGFNDIRMVAVTPTTVSEQRSTEWMPFESLAEALASDDPSRTIEGLPAPTRALLICNSP